MLKNKGLYRGMKIVHTYVQLHTKKKEKPQLFS